MWAEWFLALAVTYLVAGVFFALAFLFRGLASLDPLAARAGWGFRLMILPGVAALWPWLAKRWAR